MKTPIIVAMTLLMSHFWIAQPVLSKVQSSETYVYICTGAYSKKYHKTSSCKGLENCSKSIKKVTENSAIEKGRTKCKICYKQKE